jgi:Resolvase, N terminal domain
MAAFARHRDELGRAPTALGNDPADRLGTPAYNQEGESVMKVGIYARVACKADRPDGTIGLQLQALRAKVAVERHEVVAEFVDNGYSGLRLDRPGLGALRQAASAGTIEAVWCLSADRLARDYAYQLLILDELAGHQVTVRFSDGTSVDDARQLAQLWATMSGPVNVDGQPRRPGPKAGTHES